MQMTPELFPHTAQLLLLSTTETERETLVHTRGGRATSSQHKHRRLVAMRNSKPEHTPSGSASELHLPVSHAEPKSTSHAQEEHASPPVGKWTATQL